MQSRVIDIDGKKVIGYVVALKGFNLVFAVAEEGLAGCGAFDVKALDKFNYSAVKIGSVDGKPVSEIDDLLNGVVKEANCTAVKRGIKDGMKGNEALKSML